MREKSATSAWVLGTNPIVHSWFKILMMCVFLGILIVWGIDGLNTTTFQSDYVVLKLNHGEREALPFKDFNFRNLSVDLGDNEEIDFNLTNQILAKSDENPDVDSSSKPPNLVVNETQNLPILSPSLSPILSPSLSPILSPNVSPNSTKEWDDGSNISSNSITPRIVSWISAQLEANYSSNILAKWLTPSDEPCKDSRTADIRLASLDGGNVELLAGEIHEFVFDAVDEAGEPHCIGGDYFETDLTGEKWKSRPPVRDLGNGTYSFSLQIHPEFIGDYNLTIILLFRHYEGLKFSPSKFALDRVVRSIPIKFIRSEKEKHSHLPQLKQCGFSDYARDVWSGRWTRHAKNKSCAISRDGRYRCQEPTFPCQKPWCEGPLGLLESNGWVYSAHCSFKLHSSEEAWRCLDKKWIFWWGDSNHCDTIRNILHFILGVKEIQTVPRLFDMNVTNPRNSSQVVRFTSIFNGHWNHTSNYQGLNSLINQEYRETLKGYFSQVVVPNTIIMNSGLHDGIYWSTIRNFIKGADYAASFWSKVIEGVKRRGLRPPEIIYRTTVATGGYARSMAFNPHKMEAFNGVVLDKLRQHGLLGRVIDGFDMTYPWHFDNRCNDGVHYGRAPLKAKWRDGGIGHEYFVDLMLGHVLINALCVGPD